MPGMFLLLHLDHICLPLIHTILLSSIDAMPARIHNATLRNESDLIYPPVPAGIVPGEGILPKTKLDLVILAGESLLSLLHPLS